MRCKEVVNADSVGSKTATNLHPNDGPFDSGGMSIRTCSISPERYLCNNLAHSLVYLCIIDY